MLAVSALKHRLSALEQKSASQDVVLHFADGSTRTLRIKDPRDCLLSVWERHYAIIVGDPVPASKYEAAIELLAQADRLVDNNDPFLNLLQRESTKLLELTPFDNVVHDTGNADERSESPVN